MSDHLSSLLRQRIHQRAKGRCEYCQTTERLTGFALEIDHIIPQAQGGQSTLENLCLACRRCNAHKGYRQQAIDSQTGQLINLFNPRQQSWSDHNSLKRELRTRLEQCSKLLQSQRLRNYFFHLQQNCSNLSHY